MSTALAPGMPVHEFQGCHATTQCRCSCLLHWLLVCQCMNFKAAMHVHWLLSGNSPSYSADDCYLVIDAHHNNYAPQSRTCVVATQTHSAFGDRALAAAGPGLWNSLPPQLRVMDLSYSRFRQSLKTFLFGQWGQNAAV